MSLLPTPERERLRSQYPEVFSRPASARLATPAMILAAAAIFLFGLVDLDFSPARLLAGFSQLGWITMMMIPPDPGSSLPAYLVALGETLSIALLGTTIGALVALPVSLLAARNILMSSSGRRQPGWRCPRCSLARSRSLSSGWSISTFRRRG